MIEVKQLVKKFNNFTAVDHISFKVKVGERFALLGPNGAGKSTTIKMLTTLLRPTDGQLTLNGLDVLKQQNDARKSFGIVFQDPSLDYEMTAWENMQLHAILYGVSKNRLNRKSRELLDLVELWDRKDSLVKTFSGGMKRRLEIARGLIHEPRILFLDEPTVGLDAQTRSLLWNYIDNLSKVKKMTIFFTTHYIEEAENNADTIAIIDHGQIIQIGSPKALMGLTKTKTLEKAYLKLTGVGIRDEKVDSHEVWRSRVRSRTMR